MILRFGKPLQWAALVLTCGLLFPFGLSAQTDTLAPAAPFNLRVDAPPDIPDIPYLGISLPGDWRPFNDDSAWNQTITDLPVHPDSDRIMSTIRGNASNLRFTNAYTIPVHLVNPDLMEHKYVRSHANIIFDWWDCSSDPDKRLDGWSDVPIPITQELYDEPTSDGHIAIVSADLKTSYEMSRFDWDGDTPTCSTFNIWDLESRGVGHPDEVTCAGRWYARGGRGSGFPIIAGLIRPEALEHGEIRHALVFTFNDNREADDGRAMFIPPAARSDGNHKGSQFPIEGMRFRFKSTVTEATFDQWGLTEATKVIARAIKNYGLLLGDNGGAMALQPQLIGPTESANRSAWDARFPGLYNNIRNIPTSALEVVYTGEPIYR